MPEFEVEPEQKPPPSQNPIAAQLLVFRPRLFAAAGVVIAAFVFGTPHMLVTYHCNISCRIPRPVACDYLGIQGWRSDLPPIRGACRAIRWLPLQFR